MNQPTASSNASERRSDARPCHSRTDARRPCVLRSPAPRAASELRALFRELDFADEKYHEFARLWSGAGSDMVGGRR